MASGELHVVLGGTGVVGRATTAALLALERDVVSVSRSGGSLVGAASVAADLMDSAAVSRALRGSVAAYVTVGLPYSLTAWQSGWPVIMKNSIDACLAHGTHLVYLDNVYAYGSVRQAMTEATPIRPSSKKGHLRASLLRMLETAAREHGLHYTVGRSADFYGPGAATSVFNTFVIDRVKAGKKPKWLLNPNQPHSMTYTADLGRAMALLGTDPRARGKAWHVPTSAALTGADYMAIADSAQSTHGTMSMATLRFGALFNRAARETLEMSYQNTQPYVFDSTLFETTFATRPTPYSEGILSALG